MRKGWRKDKIQNVWGNEFGAAVIQGNLRWKKGGGMLLPIYRIEVGAQSVWQEGARDIRIYLTKFFRKMQFRLLDLIIIIWEPKGKEELCQC